MRIDFGYKKPRECEAKMDGICKKLALISGIARQMLYPISNEMFNLDLLQVITTLSTDSRCVKETVK